MLVIFLLFGSGSIKIIICFVYFVDDISFGLKSQAIYQLKYAPASFLETNSPVSLLFPKSYARYPIETLKDLKR